MTDKKRLEFDSLGQKKIDRNRLWGAQTQRSFENFKIGKEKIPEELIIALGQQKKAAAQANMELGVLSFNKEIEALAEFMTSVQMLVETTDFSKSVDAAIIVAASQQEDSPPLPVFAGYSLGPENEKPTLEVPYNLVDDKGQLKPKHEATARSMASLNKIPNELHGSLPSADESQILWERKNTNGE